MAFKVKILSVLLFICLIDSLHSASYRRMRREAEETAPEPEKTENPPPTNKEETATPKEPSPEKSESSGGSGGPPIPVDMQKMIDNFGQVFNVNNSPDWIKGGSSWISNIPWFGGGNS